MLFCPKSNKGKITIGTPFHLLCIKLQGIAILNQWYDCNPDLFKKIPAQIFYELGINFKCSALQLLANTAPAFLRKLLMMHPTLAQEIPAEAWLIKNKILGKSAVSLLISSNNEHIFKLVPQDIQKQISESQNTVSTNPSSFAGR